MNFATVKTETESETEPPPMKHSMHYASGPCIVGHGLSSSPEQQRVNIPPPVNKDSSIVPLTQPVFPSDEGSGYHGVRSAPNNQQETNAAVAPPQHRTNNPFNVYRRYYRNFPITLHKMLYETARDGYQAIVSWQPHGRAFKVINHQRFVQDILPTYFRHSKWESFLRQLNLYGFKRMWKGKDRDAYYHPCFVQYHPMLLLNIQRIKLKGKGPRKAAPETEPDFYAMPYVRPDSQGVGLLSSNSGSSEALQRQLQQQQQQELSPSATMGQSRTFQEQQQHREPRRGNPTVAPAQARGPASDGYLEMTRLMIAPASNNQKHQHQDDHVPLDACRVNHMNPLDDMSLVPGSPALDPLGNSVVFMNDAAQKYAYCREEQEHPPGFHLNSNQNHHHHDGGLVTAGAGGALFFETDNNMNAAQAHHNVPLNLEEDIHSFLAENPFQPRST